jgi:tRNA-splicing ligase RtcB
MIRVISDTKRPIKVWASDLEPEAEQQARNLASMPFIHSHVALMPDAHAGKGSTVGSVIATNGAIIPAAVGVDIGCGMCAVKLPFKVDRLGGEEKLRELRHSIERSVPVGFNAHKEMDERRLTAFKALGSNSLTDDNVEFPKAAYQLGSLGGGNHFIEICRDLDDNAWIMLHSGSRNIGKVLAERHINAAKNLMKSYFIDLPDPDLAYLAQGTPEFKAYLADLMWAQNYAKASRNEMMERVLEQVYRQVYGSGQWDEILYDYDKPDLFRVDCHHNYTNIENHGGKNLYITRKGAVSARDGEYGIIPGSMGAKSFIVKGKGAADSFCSCSHGAGRTMSRTKARQLFTAEDLAAQTAGVECRKDDGVVDEIPSSYKDIEQVMRNQADLVEPVYELKQIICVKG